MKLMKYSILIGCLCLCLSLSLVGCKKGEAESLKGEESSYEKDNTVKDSRLQDADGAALEDEKESAEVFEEETESGVVLKEDITAEDGLTYTLVFAKTEDMEDHYYNNICIYKDYSGKKECVFDLQAQGHSILGTELDEMPAFYAYEDRNEDGIKELYLTESGMLSDFQRRLIIGYFNKTFNIMFYCPMYEVKYQDFDGDGIKELFGATIAGGQVSYDIGFEEVFKLKDNQYYCYLEGTKKLANIQQTEAEKQFEKEPTLQNLNTLVGRCAYNSDVKRADKLLLEYEKMIAPHLEDTENFEDVIFILAYSSMVEDYKERWQWMQKNDGALAVRE